MPQPVMMSIKFVVIESIVKMIVDVIKYNNRCRHYSSNIRKILIKYHVDWLRARPIYDHDFYVIPAPGLIGPLPLTNGSVAA